LDNCFNRVIIDESPLGIVDFHPCTAVGTYQDEVTYLAAWATWEAFLVGKGVRAHFGYEQHGGQKLLVVHHLAGFNQSTFSDFFLGLGQHTQQVVRNRVWNLSGLFFVCGIEYPRQIYGANIKF
jgi:hypothetical protein